MLVSPAEPSAIRRAGKSSILPEKFGCDMLGFAEGRKVGIQRKEVSDLRASVLDGRLGKELGQMETSALPHRLLIVEGKVSFSADGNMQGVRYGQPWTRSQWQGVLWSAQARGVWVSGSASIPDTIEIAEAFIRWCAKDSHTSLSTRPKPGSIWGNRPTDREWGMWLLQGVDGVGVELAARIFDEWGGVPFVWAMEDAETWLQTVDGVGRVKAKKIARALMSAESKEIGNG